MEEGGPIMAGRLKRWFWITCGGVGFGLIAILLLSSGWLGFRLFQLEWKPQGQTDLVLGPVDLGFENRSDISAETGSLPFMAGIVVDLDGDLSDEVFLGGGRGQSDGLFRYDAATGGFVDIRGAHDLAKAETDATMGGAAIDVEGDGDSDLIVARESGLWLYTNTDGRLSGAPLGLDLADNTTPLSVAAGDINGDGRVDLYISGYIRNDLVKGQSIFTGDYGGYSHLFVNTSGPDGAPAWRDASREYGVWRQHNTFTAVFADLDNDTDSDLVIAQDTGTVEMYENTGSPPLRRIDAPAPYSYPMGIAAGDLDRDGQVDLFFSNVGHTLPEAMLRGDLPGDADFNPLYMLYASQGDLEFKDVAEARNVARLGFGWGTVAADLNLDGWQDMIVAQNYAKFGQPAVVHRYAGKILQNYEGQTFKPVEKRVGAGNRRFAISPLVGDFDGDHRPDLVWANLNGPARAFLNRTPDVNAIAVRLPDTAASLNARITVEAGGTRRARQLIAAQGLSSDQTRKVMIGLGAASQAETVTIAFPNGRIVARDDVPAGSLIDLRETAR